MIEMRNCITATAEAEENHLPRGKRLPDLCHRETAKIPVKHGKNKDKGTEDPPQDHCHDHCGVPDADSHLWICVFCQEADPDAASGCG